MLARKTCDNLEVRQACSDFEQLQCLAWGRTHVMQARVISKDNFRSMNGSKNGTFPSHISLIPQCLSRACASLISSRINNHPYRRAAKSSICHGAGNGGPPSWTFRYGHHDDDDGQSREGKQPWLTVTLSQAITAAGLLLGFCPAAAEAKGKQVAHKESEPELTIEAVVNSLWAVAGPMLTNLGFSGCLGVAAGMALKKVGQVLAVTIGLAFLALQGLAYGGFITVNWTHLHSTVLKALDVNKDGKVTEDDFKYWAGKMLGMLAEGVPSVGGFLAGFALGIRVG